MSPAHDRISRRDKPHFDDNNHYYTEPDEVDVQLNQRRQEHRHDQQQNADALEDHAEAPIGMNVFVVKSVVPDVALTRIFAGVTAFVIADVVALALILAFPIISVGVLALR